MTALADGRIGAVPCGRESERSSTRPPGKRRRDGAGLSVAVPFGAMIAASAAHPDAFKAAGIVDSDVAPCRSLHDNLIAVEQEQEQAHITRKSLTRDKNVTQKRLEDAVVAISLAGALVFRADPAIAAALKDLVPKTSAKAKRVNPPPTPAPVGT